METIAEVFRWVWHKLTVGWYRLAGRVMRRDKLLLGSEHKFRALLESAPDAMVIVNWHGHIALVNAQTEKLFGYDRREIIGATISDLIPERYRSIHDHHLTGYLRDSAPRPMGMGRELFARRKDGSEFPVEVSLSPLRSQEGLLVSAAIRDITERREAEEETRRLATMVESSSEAIIGKTNEGIVTSWNAGAEKLYGWTPEEMIGSSIERIFPPDRGDELEEILGRLRSGKHVRHHVTNRVSKAGERLEVEVNGSPVLSRSGDVIGSWIVGRDIAERKRAEERFKGLLEAAPDAMVIIDEEGVISLANAQAENLFGYSAEEIEGSTVEMLVPERLKGHHPKLRGKFIADPSARPMGSGLELHARRKDGSEFPVEISLSPLKTDEGMLVSAAIRDITTRKEDEEKLRYMADHDTLTGLLNRRAFEEALGREVAMARRTGLEGTMLLIDIDGLKEVNDTLGHAQGDELIKRVGDVLAGRLRVTDIVARIGGDEYAALMPDTPIEAASEVAEELLDAIRSYGIVLGAQRLRLTACAGIAAFSEGDANPTDVMVAADLALYEAKEHGRDRVAIHASGDAEGAARLVRAAWTKRIRRSLDQRALIPYQQPILRLSDNEILGYELLARMEDEEGNPIMPGAFLPTAERSGMVVELDEQMTSFAIELIADSERRGEPTLYEVNLSARSLANDDLPDLISKRIDESGIDPSRLMFEITETTAIGSVDQARAFADRLRELGCRFALDDFGAGFASFYYLKHMPLDALKIDGDFVRHIKENPTDQLLVRHMAELGAGLGMQTIAEFVEDEETLEILVASGVDCAQGYFIGRPEPAPLNGAVLKPRTKDQAHSGSGARRDKVRSD